MYFDKLLNFIYPQICSLCGRKNSENETYTCEKCSNIIKYSINDKIIKNHESKYIDELFSFFLYEGIVRRKLLEFKFFNKPYIGKMFSKIMSDFIILNNIKIDLIIPVPIHLRRYLERGYNQSEILVKNISKSIKVKYNTKILKKKKNTVPQSTLNSTMRKKNVINTYKINTNKNIVGKVILLVDDIYTTGATVNECAKILKENGAIKVYVITIAYGKFSKEDF